MTIPRPDLQALMEARLKRSRYLTFTTLSHPAETMTGFIALGLNLTHDTLHREMLVRWQFVIVGTSLPLCVALLLDVKLALSKCVPELDSPITATTDDLSVVGGE